MAHSYDPTNASIPRVGNVVGGTPCATDASIGVGRTTTGPACFVVATEDAGSIDERLSGLRSGRSANVYEVDTPEQLQELFHQLSQGGQPVENNYPGELVRLPD